MIKFHISSRAQNLIKAHVKNLIFSIVIFMVDWLMNGQLVNEIKNNYINIMITFYSIFIALFLVLSPFILSTMVKMADKGFHGDFNILVDSVRIGIKEGAVFFFIGLFAFICYTSDLPGPSWAQGAIEVFFIFSILSVCHTVYDGILMLNSLVKGMIKLFNNEEKHK